jgi:vacuolar protein sorting-associated protein 13A/C
MWVFTLFACRYVSVGDVAYVGKHPPTIVMTYKNGKGRFAEPTGFDLVSLVANIAPFLLWAWSLIHY